MTELRRPRLAATGGLLLLALTGCGGAQAERPAEARSGPEPLQSRRGTFVQRFLLTGQLRAVESTSILVPRSRSWQVQIRRIERDGVPVREGQSIAEFDNSALVSQLEEETLAERRATNELLQKEADAEARRAELDFELESKRVELEKARIAAEVPEDVLRRREHRQRQLDLARARTAVRKAKRDLESLLQASEADIAVTRVQLDKARREVEAARRDLEALDLRAPADGILVVSVNPREGRKFRAGDNAWAGMVIASLPDLSTMEVEAFLTDVDDGKIRVGNPASCTLDAYPERRFAGTIREITPVAQEVGWRSSRRRFRVRVSLDETDSEIMRPGMSVKVEVEAGKVADVLLVPRGTLDLESDPPLAFRRGGDAVEVSIGACNALECIVEDGLAEGEDLRRAG